LSLTDPRDVMAATREECRMVLWAGAGSLLIAVVLFTLWVQSS
jgi:hypothetical protein